MNDFDIKIWRLHPKSAIIKKAEKTLNGNANKSGIQFCRPYSSANSTGFWIFPPVDLDLMWDGEKCTYHLQEQWPHTEHDIVKSLVKDSDNVDVNKFAPIEGRTKLTLGEVENNIVQLWTGCIFKTPPGWCLHVRSPINCETPDFRIMEGVLETDWMYYDIWLNIVIKTKNKSIKLRKNEWPPIAQIIPIRRETTDADWKISSDEIVNRNTPESNKIFEYWLQYNKQKFDSGGKQALTKDRKKDSGTFWKKRQEAVNKDTFELNESFLKTKQINNKKIRNFGMPKCPFNKGE